MEQIGSNQSFGGQQLRFKHTSNTLNCEMVFSVYLPPQASDSNAKLPTLFWLSGLTCTDENFVQKAGAQQYAAKEGVIIIAPDTSPRGEDVPDDAEKAYDFGLGAGFYVNATQPPWNTHYRMHDYIVEELYQLVLAHIESVDAERIGIFGHSMGGHGALTLAFQHTDRFKSVSAFSPIVSPMTCPWGKKALSGYLGNDTKTWRTYDACELTREVKVHLPVLVDQGTADDFLAEQLKTDLLIAASQEVAYPMTIRMQEGYDHSYFFIASFIGEHIAFHKQALT
ncbi:MAG: S-formylglutathione hydrolase [Pseudomonadota bacterium]